MINILLIEDDPFWAKEISGSFDKEKFKVVHFDKIKNSINYINNNNDFNIILLDLCLPDSPDPFSTLNSVVPLVPYTPVVVITSLGDNAEIIEKAYSLNVEEFISKSEVQQNSLISLVKNSITRHKAKVDLDMKRSMEEMTSLLANLQSKLLHTEKMLIDLSLSVDEKINHL